MEDDLFAELAESVAQMVAIERGEAQPSRVFVASPPDARAIRERLGLTQQAFAASLGISVRTLQNWEQGHRSPEGAARVLLWVIAHDPEAVPAALAAAVHAVPPESWNTAV